MDRYTTIQIRDILVAVYKPFIMVFLILVPVSLGISTISFNPLLKLVLSTFVLSLINIAVCYYSVDYDIRQRAVLYVKNRLKIIG